MKHIVVKLMGIISIILLCCTLICGMWVGSHPVTDIRFHAIFSGIAIVFAIVTQFVYMFKCRFCDRH